jgi:hypothetical protein
MIPCRVSFEAGLDSEPEDFTEEEVFEEDYISADDVNATQIDAIERIGIFKKYHNPPVLVTLKLN